MENSPTTSEKRNEAIWATFDPQNPTDFWQRYEALLNEQKQHLAYQIISSSTSQEAHSDSTPLPFQTTFRPRRTGVITTIALISIPLWLLIIGTYRYSATTTASQFVYISLICILFFGGAIYNALKDFQVFEFTTHYFHIKTPYVAQEERWLWRRIQAMSLEQTDSSDNYELVITLLTGTQHRYSYGLTREDHHVLFQQLAQKVAEVDPGDY